MKSIFATVIGSAQRTFEKVTYNRVTALPVDGSPVISFKSDDKPEEGALAYVDCFAVGDLGYDNLPCERAFSALQMYTSATAITSARDAAKALQGLTL